MKKKLALVIAIIVVLSVVFFPMTTAHRISGDGDILTPQKEKVGTCKLEIEIKEVSSLLFCYKKSFTFAVDDNFVEEFETTSHSEADEIYLISQMYYEKEADKMNLASLIYPNDLSYAVLNLDANYYFIDNGANISHSELPIS
jgi:hypothetical protein